MSSGAAKVAIVGVGTTEHGEIPHESPEEIAVRAAVDAIADAGIEKSSIDGLITCKAPLTTHGTDEGMGPLLGINPAYSTTLDYGMGAFSLHLAAMAIHSGLASTILLTYGTKSRSARTGFARPIGGASDWLRLAGLVHVAGPAAMAVRRHMHLYGTTEEQIGWISVAQREWARMNPRAVFRDPLSISDYLAQPYIVAPLRRSDLTLISDGGAAVVVTTAERATDLAQPPVHMLGMAQQSAIRNEQNADKLMRPWLGDIATRLYERSGVRPDDVDVAYLQDGTSVWVLQMLEWYGFCGVGEAGPFLAEGNTRPGGSLPVNTHGGQLSESYTHNWMHLYEAVKQLRGDGGDRQVPGAGVALHAQTHDFWKGAATILSTRESA
ncbi:thiolase C-terminal domain-containing protein [Nocardioides sp.]|uniref:thiolase C-terminal domain-containing protein n=1 Tax=Nocardioides sp. TaxID=35761 RepID=UPI003D0C4F37